MTLKERLRAVAETVLQPGAKMPSWMAHTAQDARSEIERLEAENALMRSEHAASLIRINAEACKKIATLQAANERMEAALTSLATADLKQIGPWSMREVARAALSTHPVETEAERDERRANAVEQVFNTTYIGVIPLPLRIARAIAESDKEAAKARTE